jgi:oligoendopeptidase F
MRKIVTLFIVGSLLLSATNIKATQKERKDIAPEYKWNFKDIYADWNAWEADFKKLQEKMSEVAALKGTLTKSAESLKKGLLLQDELSTIAYKVYLYPMLQKDVDGRDMSVLGKLQQVQMAFAKFGIATSWITPELLTLPEATMMKWIDATPELKPYKFGMQDMYRNQKRVYSADKEQLLSYFGTMSGTPSSIYSSLTVTDAVFPKMTLKDGKEVTLTNGTYSSILSTDKVRENRKNAADAFYPVYAKKQNTIASIYKGILDADWASAQSRGYKSCLEASLDGNNIPVGVYENLVNTVKANTKPLQRYHKLRAKLLKLEGDYHGYDSRIPLIDSDKKYPYDEAKLMAIDAVKPLGKDYVAKMKKAIANGWLDVYETPGKRSGAYSINVYGVHPYMLLNYNGTLDYTFTLIHELGHTLHSMLSSENQPFATHGYTIFVAEVASTFNERLLLDYMLDNTKDTKERIALLQQAIEGIIGTFYIQTMFADFELQAHRLAEQGRPVTAASLTKIADDLNDAYYGDVFVEDQSKKNLLWARIPHFYNSPFYVYQYATCFASSAVLYDKVTKGSKKERRSATEKYLTLLKSGGNDYPMNQLKKAGVDLTKPEPVLAIINQLDKLIAQLEKEIEKLN